jgi:hypothetical protein
VLSDRSPSQFQTLATTAAAERSALDTKRPPGGSGVVGLGSFNEPHPYPSSGEQMIVLQMFNGNRRAISQTSFTPRAHGPSQKAANTRSKDCEPMDGELRADITVRM